MNPESIKQINEALAPVAEKLGQGAEFVYQAYLKQTIINGIQDIILGVLGLAVLITLTIKTFLWVKRTTAKMDKYDEPGMWWAWYSVISVFVWLILGLWSVSGVINGPQKLINPHYFTVNMILEDVRGDKE